MIDLNDLSVSGRRDFRHMLAANAQTLESLLVDVGVKGLMPDGDVDRALARLDKAMETSAGLGCRLVCVDIGPLPEPPAETRPRKAITQNEAGIIIVPTTSPQEAARGQDDEATRRQAGADDSGSGVRNSALAHIDAAMVDLGRRADRYGVHLAFRSELASLAALARVFRTANCPWFGWDLDPVALLRDGWGIDEAFSRLVPVLLHARVRDAVTGHARFTKPAPVGQGSTDWLGLLGRLEESGYRGWLCVDPTELTDRIAAAQAAVAFLRATAK